MRIKILIGIFAFLLTACNGASSSGDRVIFPEPTQAFAFDTIDSMSLPNDAPLMNAPGHVSWASRAMINQGVPRGDAAPQWWADRIINDSLVAPNAWNALTGWFTVFESKDNLVHDVEIHYSNFEIWLLTGSNVQSAVWRKLTSTPVTWGSYYDSDIVTWKGKASPAANSYHSYFDFKHPEILHAGTGRIPFNGRNVLGVFVRTKAWIESSHDDAKILISIGVDYYPDEVTSVEAGDFADANYLPGAGGSRFIYLTQQPKWFYMANVADNSLNTVDQSSPFARNGGQHYLTVSQWLNNLPELDE
ncbi:hypothetical protein [Vibrio sp. WXL103]|uniref:hypothetical protein n=1 Tax=Vibrio sp. WXL103 TaxID=3450710 RepID=UPI003EC90480